MAGPLGRMVPPDWRHVERFPLTALTLPGVEGHHLVWGVNWYSAFDRPELHSDGRYWVGLGDLGSIRGGHAIASPGRDANDSRAWRIFYDQGQDGSCVGFSVSRIQTWINRKRYAAYWLYKSAQVIDVWPGEDYEGTSVRAGFEVERDQGHRTVWNGVERPVDPSEGITTYRWVTSVEDALAVLDRDDAKRMGAIPWCNSWGLAYPRAVWVPGEVAERLLNEDGEIGVPTDR